MVEIECPFCGEPCRVEFAALAVDDGGFRCDGCRIEFAPERQPAPAPELARAA